MLEALKINSKSLVLIKIKLKENIVVDDDRSDLDIYK